MHDSFMKTLPVAVLATAMLCALPSTAHAQTPRAEHTVADVTVTGNVARNGGSCGYFMMLTAPRVHVDRVVSGPPLPSDQIYVVLRCTTWAMGTHHRVRLSMHRPSGVAGVRWSARAPRGVAPWWVLEELPTP